MKAFPTLLLSALALTLAVFTADLRGQTTPTVTTLYSFTGEGTDGYEPFAGLVQGRDGNFYGTTRYGGSSGYGTVSRITPTGVYTTLHSFTAIPQTRPLRSRA